MVNNDNIAVSFKLTDGSVGTMIYSASGDKAYSRESIEMYFDGKTITSSDFRVSGLHQNGKVDTFKTRGQEMGYAEELKSFVECARGQAQPTVPTADVFSTMATIFAIERALATAQVVSV